ncbi:hypothetical protein [Microbacterium sp. Root166]|uniref:hypothetical protein n=1 Tax=Microbacterium sp. Root166 TaxID=1736478 RepID=UPI001F17A2F0|nr:hypothetical protein [Microbacterium sp. Root166]
MVGVISRLAPVAVAMAVLAAVLTGCTPEPEETDPTPVFSSEAEAFAAAEETYRAYVDALNQVDLSDPETFEEVYAWTTGEANSAARTTFSQMHADSWTVSGESSPTLIEPRSAGGAEVTDVELAVCLNVAGVNLVDADGQSVVASDRPAVQTMLISLEASDATPTGWTIRDIEGREGDPQCE